MRSSVALILSFTLGVLGSIAYGQPINDAKLKLIENQRNLITLRNEKLYYEKQLAKLQSQEGRNSPKLTNTIDDLKQSIVLAKEIIGNVSETIARQRLLIATLEKGTPPTALDIALTRALGSNLAELAKKLSGNEAAQREIALLRSLLKQEARLGDGGQSGLNTIHLADDQKLAEKEFLNLLALFSGGVVDELEDKYITVTGNLKGSPYVQKAYLSYLGHHQYHMEATVQPGKMTFTVDGHPWYLNVPEDEAGAVYIIIYDLRQPNQPRMVMFNKSLLLE